MDTTNRLAAIATEMGQVRNEIQERRRVLNLFLRSVRTLDPARKEARIRAARERIEDLEGRQQALRAEQQTLIVQVIEYGKAPSRNKHLFASNLLRDQGPS